VTVDRLPEGAVAATLADLGVEVLTEDGDELVALCPGHEARTGKKDGHPSWSINGETGIHFCFSCHYKGNLITLVRDLKGTDAAARFRSEFDTHKRLVSEDHDFEVVIDKPVAEEVRTANFRPESWLYDFDEPPLWARQARRISATGAKEYEVLWDESRDAWILPLRDPHTSRLLGYQVKSQKTRFFRNRPRTVQKSETFFGWNAVRDAKKVVIVESPLDAVLLADMDVPAIALCGSRMSDSQVSLLMDSAFERVVLWLDNDTAGALETERLKKVFVDVGVQAEFITPDSYPQFDSWKDVGEMPDEEIFSVLDAAGI
jgi:hypothetical protein